MNFSYFRGICNSIWRQNNPDDRGGGSQPRAGIEPTPQIGTQTGTVTHLGLDTGESTIMDRNSPTTRGCTSTAAFGKKTGNTITTGKTTGERNYTESIHLPALPVFPVSNSVDVAQKTKIVTETATGFLNSVLTLLGVKDQAQIKFDIELTNQTTAQMYVVLPEDGVLIHVLREVLNKKDADHFDYNVDYKKRNPEQQVLEEMLCDLLVISTIKTLISKKGDEVLRNSWGRVGGSISIGPRNALYLEMMARKGDKQKLYQEYLQKCSELKLSNNVAFSWESPDQFISEYQSGDMALRLSQVEGLKDISDSLPKIPPQDLILLENKVVVQKVQNKK